MTGWQCSLQSRLRWKSAAPPVLCQPIACSEFNKLSWCCAQHNYTDTLRGVWTLLEQLAASEAFNKCFCSALLCFCGKKSSLHWAQSCSLGQEQGNRAAPWILWLWGLGLTFWHKKASILKGYQIISNYPSKMQLLKLFCIWGIASDVLEINVGSGSRCIPFPQSFY